MSEEGELPLGRRSGKSESAFRTISEVTDDLDVPQHVLRFWESKFPQVKPLKRGGGRRYYRPEDVALLRRIRDLLYSEGYTIKGVQKLLREGGHKEAGAPVTRGEPELQLDLDQEDEHGEEPSGEDDELPALDDGEEGDAEDLEFEEPQEAQPNISSSPIAPAVRRELRDILEELEQLRGLLQPRER
ncbi:MAG: MerR family transcriptional regulator [Solirubrobacterales bacterium]